MFRMWGKVFADNHLLKDFVVENPSLDLTRTKKVFAALETIAHEFDLAVPIWLPSNISDFQHHAKTRFTQDSFIEAIDFDYLEIQIIEED
jgi:hypothetical protein